MTRARITIAVAVLVVSLIWVASALAANVYYRGAPGNPQLNANNTIYWDGGWSNMSRNHMISFVNSAGQTRCNTCIVTVQIVHQTAGNQCGPNGTDAGGAVVCGSAGVFVYPRRAWCRSTANGGSVWGNCYKENA